MLLSSGRGRNVSPGQRHQLVCMVGSVSRSAGSARCVRSRGSPHGRSAVWVCRASAVIPARVAAGTSDRPGDGVLEPGHRSSGNRRVTMLGYPRFPGLSLSAAETDGPWTTPRGHLVHFKRMPWRAPNAYQFFAHTCQADIAAAPVKHCRRLKMCRSQNARGHSANTASPMFAPFWGCPESIPSD